MLSIVISIGCPCSAQKQYGSESVEAFILNRMMVMTRGCFHQLNLIFFLLNESKKGPCPTKIAKCRSAYFHVLSPNATKYTTKLDKSIL